MSRSEAGSCVQSPVPAPALVDVAVGVLTPGPLPVPVPELFPGTVAVTVPVEPPVAAADVGSPLRAGEDGLKNGLAL
jgi:hypothetical protein